VVTPRNPTTEPFINPRAGTAETEWAGWAEPARWPRLAPADLLGRTVVVLAAHPDDEVLGVGGLVTLLAALGARLRFVWATDGEASHPGSEAPVVRDLAAVRRAESAAALQRLGAGRAPRVRLELPDGGLADATEDLARRVRCVVHPDDLVLAPWSGDGHPDHEACGAAARSVGGQVLEYPVWAWHWARPGDDRVPWERAVRVDLDDAAQRAKADAVGCFRSQVAAVGPDVEDGPVLPPAVLAHFARDHEVLLR
jgi:LmbE family N-acetylglucosaminyl deacetylase